jgi:hypothetical protein
MKNIMTCLLVMLLFGHSAASALEHCKPMPKAQKEGHPWYIPEAAFTKAAATKALKELSDQVTKGVSGKDFQVENELKMIKGHLYLAYLAESKKEFGKVDIGLRDEFCKFLRNEAFVSH